MGALARFLGRARLSEVLLIGLMTTVIALFIVPMTPLAIDILIAINITLGILLLLSVLYVAKPLDFSTFPSVLLITTLFRLAISVATTKMILLHADGGQIVQQFGEMVAGGNLAVGLVAFLVITIVQFIVIAKGSERVAEVAARFSLDAMPGKQLSIDSDLRSGLLNKDEAKEKRRLVEQESRLYGSLDGAMKFVKGDAIASIVIVIINLIGGFAVGMASHGMSMAESAATFSILTIGDGLVAQIPAFFTALAAGLLVTRTTDDESERDLGPTIARQLGGKPHVLMITGGLAAVMGLIPGFPTLVFFALALMLVGGGLWMHPVTAPRVRAVLRMAPAASATPTDPLRIETGALAQVDPLVLTLSGQALSDAELAAIRGRIETRLRTVQDDSGVRLPHIRVALTPALVDGGGALGWRLDAYDAPLGSGALGAGLADAALADTVAPLVERNLSLFLGLQEVTDLLNWLGDTYPEVVKEAVRTVPTTTIAEVLRLLAEENVSLRNLRDAIEAIADAGQHERDPRLIAERVRVAMRRNIIAPLCVDGRLSVAMIGASVEDAIRGTLTMIDGQTRLAINPFQMRALVALLRQEIEASGARAILTAQDLRRPLRLITAADLFAVPVISFPELNPAVPLDVVAEVNQAPDLIGYAQQTEAAE